MTEMSKNQVIETFNKHILEFIMDIERVFPNDTDITASRKSLSRTIIMIPKSVIRAFNEHFCMVYSNEIDSGNLDFFIDNDYNSKHGNIINNNNMIIKNAIIIIIITTIITTTIIITTIIITTIIII